MDAHRLEVFSALFEITAPGQGDDVAELREIEPSTVAPPADTVERWKALGLPAAVCGDGAALYANVLGTIPVVPTPPLAGIIGRLAVAASRDGSAISPAGVQPLYVRRPDAEVARDRAHLKR